MYVQQQIHFTQPTNFETVISSPIRPSLLITNTQFKKTNFFNLPCETAFKGEVICAKDRSRVTVTGSAFRPILGCGQ